MVTIREIRIAKNLSQDRLSRLSGVSNMTIHRLEYGTPVKEESFLKVCQALGVDPKEIEDVQFSNMVERANKRWQKKWEEERMRKNVAS
jgi:transcriptional regulator with XRE-family HTH domain